MDPNSIIGRIVAQVGQQQAPQPMGGGTTFAPIAEMLQEATLGGNAPRFSGPLGQDGGRLYFRAAQLQSQGLDQAMRMFGPPPPGITTTEQMTQYYDGLVRQRLQGASSRQFRPTGEQP